MQQFLDMAEIPEVLLSTTVNQLSSYDHETNSFLVRSVSGLRLVRIAANKDEIEIIGEVCCHKSGFKEEEILYATFRNDGFLLFYPLGVEFLSMDGKRTQFDLPLLFEIKKTVVAATYLKDYLVLLMEESFVILDFYRERIIEHTVQSIKKCTALIAHFTHVSGKSIYDISVTFCDGTTVYSYVGDCMRVIDSGRVLGFTRTAVGIMACFETNWRFSPLDLFSGDPLNMENLQLPRNHTASNEARLQLYDHELSCLDDHSLPNHNQPTLISESKGAIAVSGFYQHVISLFQICDNKIVHMKDISIGSEFKCAGLTFLADSLLLMKRTFSKDNILLTFPPKTTSTKDNVILKRIYIQGYMDNKTVKRVTSPAFKSFPEYDPKFDGSPGIMKPKSKTPKQKKKKENSVADEIPLVTEEEVQKKVLQILESYQYQPSRRISSDSELSEETLELLSQCQPRHPFVPIPVSTSSDSSQSEENPNETLKNDENEWGLDFDLFRKSHDKSSISIKAEMIDPNRLILPGEKTRPSFQPAISDISNDIQKCSITEDKNLLKISDKLDSVNNKLDKIIKLMEKQNCLLEIIAKTKLDSQT